jgi:hypothetical protein
MSWAAVRDAIQGVIVTASGLAASQVIWQYQSANEPPMDDAHGNAYIALSLSSPIGIGIDGIVATTDLSRPAGQEIKLAVNGVREITLTIEVYTNAVVSSAIEADALEIAERIRTSFTLPSIMDALAAVQVATFDTQQPVQYVPAVVAVAFRGRAVYEVRCYLPAPAVADYIGYIAKATGTITAHGSNVDPLVIPYKIS